MDFHSKDLKRLKTGPMLIFASDSDNTTLSFKCWEIIFEVQLYKTLPEWTPEMKKKRKMECSVNSRRVWLTYRYTNILNITFWILFNHSWASSPPPPSFPIPLAKPFFVPILLKYYIPFVVTEVPKQLKIIIKSNCFKWKAWGFSRSKDLKKKCLQVKTICTSPVCHSNSFSWSPGV